MKDVLDSALAYARRSWSVIPLWPREKRPLIPWAPYQHHRPDEAEIRQWFRRWPSANVGIVTGAVSSLVVVDVDPLHGGDDSLKALEQAHGPLPATIKATTGGGGLHVYLAHPGGLVHNQVGLVPGIDLRGDGGFVVAPPSVHPSGRRYAWLEHDRVDHALPAPMPTWLLHLVRERGDRPGHSLAHWRRLVKEGIQEGERNNSIASLAGHLFWHRVDPKVIRTSCCAGTRAAAGRRCPMMRWHARSTASCGSTSRTMHASENFDAAADAAPCGSVRAGSSPSPAQARRSYA